MNRAGKEKKTPHRGGEAVPEGFSTSDPGQVSATDPHTPTRPAHLP